MPGTEIAVHNPQLSGKFFVVNDIPQMSTTNKFLFRGPGGFKLLIDLNTGNIFSTDCVWCNNMPGANYRIPQEVRTLFSEMDGMKLSEISVTGRQRRLEEFVEKYKNTKLQTPEEADMNPDAVLERIDSPMYGPESWPSSPEEMRALATGTLVLLDMKERADTTAKIVSGSYFRKKKMYTIRLFGKQGMPRQVGPLEATAALVGLLDRGELVCIYADDLVPTTMDGVVRLVNQDQFSIKTLGDWIATIWLVNVIFSYVLPKGATGAIGWGNAVSSIPWAVTRINTGGNRFAWVSWATKLKMMLGAISATQVRNLPALRYAGGSTGDLVWQIGSTGVGWAAWTIGPYGKAALMAGFEKSTWT